MRLSYSRWFDIGLWLILGALLGLFATPFVWGDATTGKQFYLGILGNVIAAFLVLPGFWLLNFLEARFSQIRKFFGIQSGSPFFIFVGHLNYPGVPAGVAGVLELNEAHELRAKLQSFVPGLGDAYLLRRLRLVDVDINVIVADKDRSYVEYKSCSYITIGSGGSNGVSEMAEKDLYARLDFAEERIRIGNERNENSAGRGLITCSRDSSGHVWFYIAGQTQMDTIGSAQFLRANLSVMFQKHPKTNFYYLLDTTPCALGFPPNLVEDRATN